MPHPRGSERGSRARHRDAPSGDSGAGARRTGTWRAALAALAIALPVACSAPDRGELTYQCTPDGETRPRYLLTKVDRGDGLAVGAVRDLLDGRWLALARPVPVTAEEITWAAGEDAFVVARRTGDLRVLDRARAGLKLRGECDRVPFVAAPGAEPGGR